MFVSCRLYDNRHHCSDLPLLLAFCSSHSRTVTGNFFACLSCLCLNNLEISNLSQPKKLYIHVQTQHQKLLTFQNHLENHLLVVVVLVVVAVVLVVGAVVLVVVAVAVVVDGGGG